MVPYCYLFLMFVFILWFSYYVSDIFCSHTLSMKVDERSDQKSDIKPHWMAAHACLKNAFMEDEKYHNLMTWLIERGILLTIRLLSQGYQSRNWLSTLKYVYGRHHDLVYPYNVAVPRIIIISEVFATEKP